jgi:Ca2+/H+ antiporter
MKKDSTKSQYVSQITSMMMVIMHVVIIITQTTANPANITQINHSSCKEDPPHGKKRNMWMKSY